MSTAYIILNGLWSISLYGPFSDLSVSKQILFWLGTRESLCSFLIFVYLTMKLHKFNVRPFLLVIPFLSVLFGPNVVISGCATALSIPFWGSWSMLIPISYVLWTKSAMAYGTAAVVLITYFVGARWTILLAPISVILYYRVEMFSDTNRFGMWQIALDWWWNSANIWLGSGLGSMKTVLPRLQLAHQYHTDLQWFVDAHSLYVQTLIELGIIGSIVVAVPLIRIIVLSQADRVYKSVLFGFLAMGLGLWPFYNYEFLAFAFMLMSGNELDRLSRQMGTNNRSA